MRSTTQRGRGAASSMLPRATSRDAFRLSLLRRSIWKLRRTLLKNAEMDVRRLSGGCAGAAVLLAVLVLVSV